VADVNGHDAVAPAGWQIATVVDMRPETARMATLALRPERPVVHVPGQHVVLRLTAPDGYTASRSYSIASAPGDGTTIELGIERLDDGEVSTFLHDDVVVGDELEIRGPIGNWFAWDATSPAVLVGGGSGVVPLVSMLRHARATGHEHHARVVVSVRSPSDLPYAADLAGPAVSVAFTREAPSGHGRAPGRLTIDDLGPVPTDATVYVCGSNLFANHVTALLGDLDVPTSAIRIERFGPTG
jgi:ferredoxin-NADP reductase